MAKRPSAKGYPNRSLVLWSFRQRLFLGAIRCYAVLNLVIRLLRNQFLLQQVLLGAEGPRIDDALRIVGPNAGKRREVFLARAVQVDGLSVVRRRITLLGRRHLMRFGRIRTLVARGRSRLLLSRISTRDEIQGQPSFSLVRVC